LFLQVRRSVGADSVMCYDGPVKMLNPANLNSSLGVGVLPHQQIQENEQYPSAISECVEYLDSLRKQ